MNYRKFAIVSVYDKEGIVEFSRGLNSLGYGVISTSKTYTLLKDNGVDVVEVSSITGFPEILDGRVKTLHPLIHGGILHRNIDKHLEHVKINNIPVIDLVVVNLYPFEETLKNTSDLEDIIENIDIGGPTLLRAGAKNFERVLVVVDKSDYGIVLEKLSSNQNTIDFRMFMASKAFNHVARYDGVIASFFNSLVSNDFPEETAIPLKKAYSLRYGENPHQKASAYISLPQRKEPSVLTSDVLWGKELSYNNILDADTALEMIKSFKNDNFCCIIKHNTPSGAAISDTILDAYKKAFECDPVSAFGGIVGFSGRVDFETAKEFINTFYEVIVSPEYDQDALDVLKTKKNLRIIRVGSLASEDRNLDFRSVGGGLLIQERDSSDEDVLHSKVVTNRKPTEKEYKDLAFAWKVVKFVKSNAIVLVKDGMTIGISGGQTSRVDAVKISIQRAKERGFSLKGAVCASDAFFPFKDSIEILANEGISAIVQPGGSVRDIESIDEANKHSIAMVFTNIRHFRH
ncbi:MAG: bifunctional phosphoribosylaminoimidazolecarboxamide formyltransferase/IMP cyclohydrolase [Brevinematales bacterium]|nr:bifunctional phosphoribosylaminoimidazolecarboxamide formyltransferase/IMP cyclohydrolase [Brevinematales bacterium]